MPLIPAGEHARLLTAMLSSRAPVIESSGCSLTAGSTTTAAGDRWPSAGAGRESRRPARQFSDHPLPLAELRAIVTSAYATQRRDWPPAEHGDQKLVTVLTAYRVAGLRPGTYLIEPPGWGPVTALPDTAWLPELRLEYADAPALLHICGDLQAACRLGAGSGYGALLVRAGALGHAAWLSAVSAGLAGTAFGYASHRVTETARLTDRGLRHLMTVAVGIKSPGQEGDSTR